ncbi:MAG: universal stress protein [Afipia sp.]
MIKDIILNIEPDASRDGVSDYAISIAEEFESHLAGVGMAGLDIPTVMMPDFPTDLVGKILLENEEIAKQSIKRFEQAATRQGISFEQRLVTRQVAAPNAFSAMARRFDLSVVMQTDVDEGAINEMLIEATLFDSGRPIVVVPYFQKDPLKLDKIVCCWDGSRAATRAINDAMPFLKRAKSTELFIVINEKTSGDDEIRGVEMANHLARHGVHVDVETTPVADIDVPDAILSHAADCSANLIVMGGYGHSRLREFVLGGATRTILSSMTAPVFMSH